MVVRKPPRKSRVPRRDTIILSHGYEDNQFTRWLVLQLAQNEQILGNEPVALVLHEALAPHFAVRAVIDWRIEDRSKANSEFQTAVEFDPVWMVRRWVTNNYSASTTAIIRDLQSAESERRSEAAQDQRQVSR
jgi:hypothetical protein